MDGLRKLVIIVCGLVFILFWGLPTLFASEQMASFFGVVHAGVFVYWARFFGMMALMWGIMLIAAAACEDRLVVIFTIMLLLFAIVLSLLMAFWLGELDMSRWVWWLNLVVSIILFLLLVLFHPKKAAAKAEKRPEPPAATMPPRPPEPAPEPGTSEPSI
ncbi:MAG TPA: hypothetical protein VMX35_07225 [Acidobacteriota bacterium]|nr:hypothetical protein [Acidobacteriota bacterium]